MFHSTNMDRLTYQQTILYLYPSGLNSLSMRGYKHSNGREWGPEGEHTRLMSKEDPRMTDDEQRERLSSHREIYSAYSRKVPSLAYMLPEYHSVQSIYLSIYLGSDLVLFVAAPCECMLNGSVLVKWPPPFPFFREGARGFKILQVPYLSTCSSF